MNLFTSGFKYERLLLTVFLVAIFALIISLFGPPSGFGTRAEAKDFWIKKTHTSRKYSMIVAGDSRIYRGISPRVMEKVLVNYRGFNVGYSSAGFAKPMFDKIERHIDFGAETPVVVLGVSPWSLTPKAGENKHLRSELERKKEEIIQARYFSFVNSVFAPYTIKEVFDYYSGKDEKKNVSYRYTSRGWVASNTDFPNPKKALGSERTAYINNQVSNELLSDLLNKIEEWERKGAEVFAFRPPANRAMEALEDSLSGFCEQEIVRSIEQAGATWLDFNIDNYFSYDGSHLDEQSAIRLSHDLAVKIKKELY
jgi:hypothetical protein